MEINERRLRRQFYDVRSAFEMLTGTTQDNCFLGYIFSEMVEASGCVQKEKLIDSFLEQTYGVIDTGYYKDFVSRNARYEEVMNCYRFSGRMAELGTFWRGLVEGKDYIMLEKSRIFLGQTDSFLLPKLFRAISLWELEEENYENKMNMRERKQHYNAYRRLVRETILLLENSVEILHMIDS